MAGPLSTEASQWVCKYLKLEGNVKRRLEQNGIDVMKGKVYSESNLLGLALILEF